MPCHSGTLTIMSRWVSFELQVVNLLRPRFGYVESLVLITIVFLELVFDVAWHAMAKPANKSYKYGQLHEEAFQQHSPLDMQMAPWKSAEGLLSCMR